MTKHGEPVHILIADDDEDDRKLAERALRMYRLNNGLHFVTDGEDLLDYLYHRGRHTDELQSPRPGLILLDLNMPRLTGREALATIKADRQLRRIPVVILTTSQAEEDILRSYDLGVNSYITKPVTFQGMAEVMRTLSLYWFEIVRLPEEM